MERQFSSGSRQAPDPYDQHLEAFNYYRKHTARDSSCLFRVVSEQMYGTQMHHLVTRKKCVYYMRKHRKFFQTLIEGDIDDYLEDMTKPRTYGTLVELQAMGYMFQRTVTLFEPFDLGRCFFNRPYSHEVLRVFLTHEHHFDSVFTSDYIKDAAICQSICYEIIYKDVYKLPDVSFAVEHMLYGSTSMDDISQTECNEDGYCTRIMLMDGRRFYFDLPHSTFCILENYKLCHFHSKNFPLMYADSNQKAISGQGSNTNEKNDSMLPQKFISCVRQLLLEGITPFPYKVAKALDPNMYRNIELDAWREERKIMKMQNWYSGDANFKVGAKCHVNLSNSDNTMYTCHIQEIAMDQGYCVVYVEQLGEKRIVPYNSLEPLPPDQFKPWSLPYRLQRQMQKCNGLRQMRPFNYRLKCPRQISAQDYCFALTKAKASDYTNIDDKCQCAITSAVQHHNNYFRRLNQFTHLENFRPQPIEYCTMPLSVNHGDRRQDQDSKAFTSSSNGALDENTSRAVSCSSLADPSKNDYANGREEAASNALVDADENSAVESYALDNSGTEYQCYYPMPSYAAADDYYCCGYDGMNPVPILPTSNSTYYYTYGPGFTSTNSNIYLQTMPSTLPYSASAPGASAAIAQPVAAYNPNQVCYPALLPPPSTIVQPMPLTVPNIVQTAASAGNLQADSSATPGLGRAYADVKKSIRISGSDLPTDVATLRYFFNLGIDYYNKLNNESKEENKESANKYSTDRSVVKLDENANEQVMTKPDSNNNSSNITNLNTQSQATTSNKPLCNQHLRRFPSRYFNSKERQGSQRNISMCSGSESGHQHGRSGNAHRGGDVNRNSANVKTTPSTTTSAMASNGGRNHVQQHLSAGGNSAGRSTPLYQGTEQAIQTSPMMHSDALANVAENAQPAYINYAAYELSTNDQSASTQHMSASGGGSFIPMTYPPPSGSYGIYQTSTPAPGIGMYPPQMNAYPGPYMATQQPAPNAMPSMHPSVNRPLHAPLMPPTARNGFYPSTDATIGDPSGGIAMPYMNCPPPPPPIPYYYSAPAQVGSVGSNSSTPITGVNMQFTPGGTAVPVATPIAQQGFWVPPPPPPQPVLPLPPGTSGSGNNGSPAQASNRREKQQPPNE